MELCQQYFDFHVIDDPFGAKFMAQALDKNGKNENIWSIVQDDNCDVRGPFTVHGFLDFHDFVIHMCCFTNLRSRMCIFQY